MRQLLAKDLLILRRSRLLVSVLVVYPIAISLLIGLAISRSPAKPKVAIVDETSPGQTVQVGSRRVQVSQYAEELFSQVQAVHASSRAQAVGEIKNGTVLAAVVIPHDIAARLTSGISQARLEVLYDGDALEQSLVQSQLDAALAHANLGFSEQIQQAAAQAIALILKGGNLGVLGAPPNLIGLSETPNALRSIITHEPPGPRRSELERIESLAGFAAQNLSTSSRLLATVSQPIKVHSTLLHGRRTPLNTFAVVVAVSVSLMFVCVLLAAGSVALEREEHTLARLVRGTAGDRRGGQPDDERSQTHGDGARHPPARTRGALITRGGLLAEKLVLAAGCAFLLAFAMLAGIAAFVTLDWSRVAEWLLALAFAALAFAALGIAIGALAREVRAASLLAFLLSLPLAFLALVPSGSVAHGLYDAITAISFAFPFKASLQALDTAVNGASPALAGSLAHLLGLIVLFLALARVGLRRLD
ncbi:MAG TPA: ABC transporter permease [Solirubrobacteraceae bacterium]|jgi:ABC-2 type transport system permease protein